MWRLLGTIVDDKNLRQLIAIFSVSAVLQGIALAMMIPFLQELLGGGPRVGTWLGVLVGLAVVSFVVEFYGIMRSYRISVYDVCDALIEKIADHTLQLPLGWFDAKREAQIASAMSREIDTLSHVASIIIPALVKQFVTPAVIVIAVLIVDWRLALIMIACIPLLRWGWLYMQKSIVKVDEVQAQAAADSAGRLIEYARLQPILRANGVTQRGWGLLEDALARENDTVHESLRAKGRPNIAYSSIIQTAFALVIIAGLVFMLRMDLDPISYIVIAVISVRVVQPLTLSVMYGTEIHASEAALHTVNEILTAEPLPEPTPEHAVTSLESTTITVTDVSFGYVPERKVVHNVNFTARQGTMTALVGPSGCGKSTMLRLVARFWDVDSGSVQVGGTDVRNIPTPTLMRNISMVFQDVYLFDTTIRENVRMARPDATDAELEAAARAARLDQVIASLPDGWDTQVGQGGLKLSGGERQRVSIARAFIKDAPILLLDEITSALDGENEAAITAVMKELTRGRTVIVVAHRLSTIRDADQVIVFGKLDDDPTNGYGIVESGTFPELADAGGPFSNFLAASTSAKRWLV